MDVCQGGLAGLGLWWDRFGWARVTDEAKRRRQGLVVCRAALPFEGVCDACPGVALAPDLTAPAAWRSRMVCAEAGRLGGGGDGSRRPSPGWAPRRPGRSSRAG